MQQLLGASAGPNPDSRFLRELFLQHLPNHVRMVLAAANIKSVEALAQLTDKVIKVAKPTVLAVHVHPTRGAYDPWKRELGPFRNIHRQVPNVS